MINPLDYYTETEWELFHIHSGRHRTPFILINLDIIKKNFLQLKELFPFVKIYYAVKANPNDKIIKTLDQLECNFDIASRDEYDQLLALNVNPNHVSYGNTIKKARDVSYFYNRKGSLYAIDNEQDLQHIAYYAPYSRVFCRFLFEGGNADWSLSKKFGCSPDMAVYLLKKASQSGLRALGVSFHVGSQQNDVQAWKKALQTCKYIFDKSKQQGVILNTINMGGGLPCNYYKKNNSLQFYAKHINEYIKTIFPNYNELNFMMQPGRSLVGNAGVLVSQIIQVTQKDFNSKTKWVYIDAGKFNGLIETMNECIKYPIYQYNYIPSKYNFILAGPTCDSCDILYENHSVALSDTSKEKDKLYFLSCGAYTASYASVNFNGYKPIKTYCF